MGVSVNFHYSSAVYGSWQGLSLNATPLNYNGYLRNGATGAKKLSLPLTAPGVGGTNADIVRRPVAGEDPLGILYNEQLFTKASLRILLSDTAADITTIPGITATAPVYLDGNWNTPFVAGVGGYPPAYGAPMWRHAKQRNGSRDRFAACRRHYRMPIFR